MNSQTLRQHTQGLHRIAPTGVLELKEWTKAIWEGDGEGLEGVEGRETVVRL